MLKKFFVTVMVMIIFMTGSVFGETSLTGIKVALNSVSVFVNGKKINEPNIIYEGKTYVPLSAISSALGQEVSWDGAKREVSILNKSEKEGDWKLVRTFEGNGSKDLEPFTINSDEWKIEWETSKASMTDMMFQVTLNRISDNNNVLNIVLAAGDDKGVSLQKYKGEFSLSTYTSQNFIIKVYEKVAK